MINVTTFVFTSIVTSLSLYIISSINSYHQLSYVIAIIIIVSTYTVFGIMKLDFTYCFPYSPSGVLAKNLSSCYFEKTTFIVPKHS